MYSCTLYSCHQGFCSMCPVVATYRIVHISSNFKHPVCVNIHLSSFQIYGFPQTVHVVATLHACTSSILVAYCAPSEERTHFGTILLQFISSTTIFSNLNNIDSFLICRFKNEACLFCSRLSADAAYGRDQNTDQRLYSAPVSKVQLISL